ACSEPRAEAALDVPARTFVDRVAHLGEPLDVGVAQREEGAVSGRLGEARAAPKLATQPHFAAAQRHVQPSGVTDFRSDEERAFFAADAAFGLEMRAQIAGEEKLAEVELG